MSHFRAWQKKDFWDLAAIFNHHTLAQVLTWHKQKYPSKMLAINILNAITYFDNANESENTVCLKGKTWDEIKENIRKAVREYLK